MRHSAKVVSILLLICMALAACRSTYYAVWEKFGRHKRDLLRSNVEAARDEQKAASEQFKSALEQLKALYGFDGGELETAYNKFNSEYERCESRAEDVRSRISKVEVIAADLFKEWEEEMNTITNSRLRSSSRQKLIETRAKYDQLHASMKRAEESMSPILVQFRDNVLYLKHNLNAQAIGALRGEALQIEAEIGRLINDMNASIAEADKFIRTLE